MHGPINIRFQYTPCILSLGHHCWQTRDAQEGCLNPIKNPVPVFGAFLISECGCKQWCQFCCFLGRRDTMRHTGGNGIWDSIVINIMAKLHLEDPGFKSGQVQDTLLLIVQGTTHPPTQCAPGFFVGRLRGRVVRLIHLYLGPMVRIKGSYTSAPPIYVLRVDREKLYSF